MAGQTIFPLLGSFIAWGYRSALKTRAILTAPVRYHPAAETPSAQEADSLPAEGKNKTGKPLKGVLE